MSSDEYNGYSNWDTFTVDVVLANNEPLYEQALQVVRAARDHSADPGGFTEEQAGAALKVEFNRKELYAAPELDMGKVNWGELAASWLIDVNEAWPVTVDEQEFASDEDRFGPQEP